MWRHPNYYKELRKRNKSDRVISGAEATAEVERAPGQGLKRQASSAKLFKQQAASFKPQAASVKLEATSLKLLDS
jgi:hypothetical protein